MQEPSLFPPPEYCNQVLVCIFEKAFLHVSPRDFPLSYSFVPTASNYSWSEKLWSADMKCAAPNGAGFGITVRTQWCRGTLHTVGDNAWAATDAAYGRFISSLRSSERHQWIALVNLRGIFPLTSSVILILTGLHLWQGAQQGAYRSRLGLESLSFCLWLCPLWRLNLAQGFILQ